MIRTPIPFNTGLGKRKLRLPGTPGLRAGVFGAEPPLPGFRAPRVVRWPAARSRARAQPSRRTDRPASGAVARWRPEEPGEGDRGVGAPEPRLPLGPLGRGAGARRCRPSRTRRRGGGFSPGAAGETRALPALSGCDRPSLHCKARPQETTPRDAESRGDLRGACRTGERRCVAGCWQRRWRGGGRRSWSGWYPHICPLKPFACVVVALAKRCHCALALGLAMRRRRGGLEARRGFPKGAPASCTPSRAVVGMSAVHPCATGPLPLCGVLKTDWIALTRLLEGPVVSLNPILQSC